jgi:hypothetical protein
MKIWQEILVRLGLVKTHTPHPKYARIDGIVLFSDEYKDPSKIVNVRHIFEKKANGKVMLRIPLSAPELFASFKSTATVAQHNGMEVVALLDDRPGDGANMMKRLSLIKSGTPFIRHIELFNELPHMNHLYNGPQIASCDDLIRLTNQYADWIHQNLPQCSVISMAPYNSLDPEDKYWGISNWDILKRLALETRVDCTAIHCYGMEARHKAKLAELTKALNEWHGQHEKQYALRKKIWVTECGSGDRKMDVEYYNNWTSVFAEYLKADKIFWYRMTIAKPDDNEANFAMEVRSTGETSPLIKTLQA